MMRNFKMNSFLEQVDLIVYNIAIVIIVITICIIAIKSSIQEIGCPDLIEFVKEIFDMNEVSDFKTEKDLSETKKVDEADRTNEKKDDSDNNIMSFLIVWAIIIVRFGWRLH